MLISVSSYVSMPSFMCPIARVESCLCNTNKILILLHILTMTTLLLLHFFLVFVFLFQRHLWSDPKMLPGTF